MDSLLNMDKEILPPTSGIELSRLDTSRLDLDDCISERLRIQQMPITVEQKRTLLDTEDMSLRTKIKDAGYESIADFCTKDHERIIAELQRCYVAEGTCDLCVGRRRMCIPSCHQERIDENGKPWKWLDFYRYRQFEGNSPPTCSMHFTKVAKPRFDLFQGMTKGISLEELTALLDRMNTNPPIIRETPHV